jgi:DNA-binding response OmpR family regulator
MTKADDVLIVDDDPDLLETLELLLRGAGYATRTALNGRQALEAVRAKMPTLILLDMLMPVMNGAEFAQEFRARYGSRVPIVIVTAAEHAQRRSRGLDATEVLAKPFDMAELLELVARYARPAE